MQEKRREPSAFLPRGCGTDFSLEKKIRFRGGDATGPVPLMQPGLEFLKNSPAGGEARRRGVCVGKVNIGLSAWAAGVLRLLFAFNDGSPLPEAVRRNSSPFVFSTGGLACCFAGQKESMRKLQLKSLRDLDSEEGTVKLVDGNCSLTTYTR